MKTLDKPLPTRGITTLTPPLRALTRRFRAALLYAVLAVSGAGFGLAQAEDARFERGLLWRVEAPGATPPSYLYGTVHVSDERTAHMPKAISRLLDGLGTVATEVAFERADIRRANERIYLPEGERLSDRLAPAEFAALREMMADAGVSTFSMDRLTPFGAIVFLTVRPSASRPSLDLQIFRAAKARQLKTLGLESVDEQFDATERIGESHMLAELRAAARAPKAFMQSVDALIERYLAEDIGLLAERVGARSGGEVGAELIEKRNRKMLARVRPLVDAGSALIAVGASHLGGPEGLLAALAAAGYKVTRTALD